VPQLDLDTGGAWQVITLKRIHRSTFTCADSTDILPADSCHHKM
jgi:hypothetical protein